jgi:predicted membrane-bound mannosyltransferase
MAKDVDVILVNNLAVSGFLNGVINLAFSTSQFIPVMQETSPGEFEAVVDAADVVTINMRMDLWLAQQVRDRLNALIEQNTKPAVTN